MIYSKPKSISDNKDTITSGLLSESSSSGGISRDVEGYGVTKSFPPTNKTVSSTLAKRLVEYSLCSSACSLRSTAIQILGDITLSTGDEQAGPAALLPS